MERLKEIRETVETSGQIHVPTCKCTWRHGETEGD